MDVVRCLSDLQTQEANSKPQRGYIRRYRALTALNTKSLITEVPSPIKRLRVVLFHSLRATPQLDGLHLKPLRERLSSGIPASEGTRK